MTSSLTRAETLSLLSLFAACVGIILNTFHGDGEPLIASLAFSGIAFALTYSLIVWLGNTFIKAGLKGKDMSKLKKVEMSVFISSTPRPLANLLIPDQRAWVRFVP
jgi:UDP-N-acetylglucosamine--dolichyl-phosphate N-acetylglucosaminephosphotransferase